MYSVTLLMNFCVCRDYCIPLTYSSGLLYPDNSSVVKCPLPNWKVGCSIHSLWVNCRSAPWARALTSTAPARSTIQASACRQLPSPQKQKKNQCMQSAILRMLLDSDKTYNAVTGNEAMYPDIQGGYPKSRLSKEWNYKKCVLSKSCN